MLLGLKASEKERTPRERERERDSARESFHKFNGNVMKVLRVALIRPCDVLTRFATTTNRLGKSSTTVTAAHGFYNCVPEV